MGSRANLVLVENGAHRLFYSHWAANTLDRDLFWGPEHVRQFMLIQREVSPDDWLGESWAEGGALLDLDRRRFMLFGGEDIRWDIQLRRIYLGLLRQVWDGWETAWADDGIAALASYVGHTLPFTPSRPVIKTFDPPLDPNGEHRGIFSVLWRPEDLRFYSVRFWSRHCLLAGPSFLEALRQEPGQATMLLGDDVGNFPQGGCHIDIARNSLDFWDACFPNAAKHVAAYWPGWAAGWHKDRFESQVERSSGRLQFPQHDVWPLKEWVAKILLHQSRQTGLEIIQTTVQRLGGEGKQVQVNPLALRDDPLDYPIAERREIVQRLLGRLPEGY
jgi:hypothetical protein